MEAERAADHLRRRFTLRKSPGTPRAPAVFELPLPGHMEGAEEFWRQRASDAILSRRVRPFVGPVEVALTFRDGRRARAIGDLPNECLQLLIGTKLIASADSAILRRLTLSWGGVEGVRIEIHAAEGWGS
jgi:hypothetical protein